MDAENVKSKIKEVLADNHVTANNLAKTFGVNQKTLHNQINDTAAISISTIILLSKRFPTLSMEWLLRGVGDMYLQCNTKTEENKDSSDNVLLEKHIALLEKTITALEKTIDAQEKTIIAQRNENDLLKKTDFVQGGIARTA